MFYVIAVVLIIAFLIAAILLFSRNNKLASFICTILAVVISLLALLFGDDWVHRYSPSTENNKSVAIEETQDSLSSPDEAHSDTVVPKVQDAKTIPNSIQDSGSAPPENSTDSTPSESQIQKTTPIGIQDSQATQNESEEALPPSENRILTTGTAKECLEFGHITSNGQMVSSFGNAYIINGEYIDIVNSSITDSASVYALRVCDNYDTTWYDIYDIYSHEHYGWVDCSFLNLDGLSDFAVIDNSDGASQVIIPNNSLVVLRTVSGYFLSLNEDNCFYANKAYIDESCKLKVLHNDNMLETNFISMMSQKYLSVYADSPPYVLCSYSDKAASWERFRLFKDNNYITIASIGKEVKKSDEVYLRCDEESDERAIGAQAKTARQWEDFSLFVYFSAENVWINPITLEKIYE